MPVQASGGARELKRKHDERMARRRRMGFSEKDWIARYAALGPAPADPEKAHTWVARVCCLAIEECCADPGVPPEQRREQIGRLAAQAVKTIDPAKLAERLDRLDRAQEETDYARAIPTGETGASREAASLS
jgi:hypothetical protein